MPGQSDRILLGGQALLRSIGAHAASEQRPGLAWEALPRRTRHLDKINEPSMPLWTRRSLLQFPAAALFNVRDHGARGDGAMLDTQAIQKAIDACTAAGGGVVYLPTGVFLSGTLVLKDNVTLHLSPGAVLRGSRNLSDFRPPHFLYARRASNITIEGRGMIDGQGDMNWTSDFKPKPNELRVGPLIELVGCRDVRIQEIAIRNSPRWTIHPKNCERVWIRGISIINHLRGPNTDGIDPDSSRYVHISDCYLEGGDDCIVIKTSNVLPWIREGYGEPVRPCENITVTNCTLVSSASALKLGTESLADIRHCVFSNCVIRGSRTGLALLGKDGGRFENISFSNITIETLPKHGKGASWPIAIDLEKRFPDSRVGAIRDVSFSGIQISTAGRVLVGGMPGQPIENLSLRDVTMRVTGFERVEGVGKPRGAGLVQASDPEADYGSKPAALIFANVKGLDLRDIRVLWDAGEPAPERHAIYAARVENLRIDGFEGRQAAAEGRLAAIALKDARQVFVTRSRAQRGAGAFLSLEDTPREQVELAENNLSQARETMR